MRLRLTRRAALLMPLLLAACGGEEEAPAPEVGGDFPPLRYGYLPPIKLNVQRVETARGFVPPIGEDEMIGLSPVDPVDTLYAMARDRLQPVAQSGTATFRVVTTSITRHHDTLNGVLAVRLDVRDGDNAGYVVARVTANHSSNITSRRAAVYDLLKSMMFQMNVELEYQLRNKLKAWVVNPQAAPAPASAPQAQPTPPPANAPEPVPEGPPETPPGVAPEPPPPAEVPPPLE
jgi:hypothetical protein